MDACNGSENKNDYENECKNEHDNVPRNENKLEQEENDDAQGGYRNRKFSNKHNIIFHLANVHQKITIDRKDILQEHSQERTDVIIDLLGSNSM